MGVVPDALVFFEAGIRMSLELCFELFVLVGVEASRTAWDG